jgi:hypothetical protein
MGRFTPMVFLSRIARSVHDVFEMLDGKCFEGLSCIITPYRNEISTPRSLPFADHLRGCRVRLRDKFVLYGEDCGPETGTGDGGGEDGGRAQLVGHVGAACRRAGYCFAGRLRSAIEHFRLSRLFSARRAEGY